MILSNVAIVEALAKGLFSIDPPPASDPTAAPFNTSAVDLRLGAEVNIPKTGGSPIQLDLRKGGIAQFLAQHCESRILTPGMFICQLILEEVRGRPANAPNQFMNQRRPVGT
jgi:deoxycytidine triphosphate deaminase